MPAIGLILFASLLAPQGAGEGRVAWIKDTLAGGLEKARTAGKPVILYFAAKDAPECHLLARTVFSDPEVLRASAGFTCLYVDCTDKAVFKEAQERFSVRSLPVVYFLDANLQLYDAAVGYVEASLFVSKMKRDRRGEAPRPSASTWVDTHRVILKNGNAIDGRLEERNEEHLLVRYDAKSVAKIKVVDVVKIELLAIRAKGTEAATIPVAPKDPDVGPGPGPDAPEGPVASEAMKKQVDDLVRLVKSSSEAGRRLLNRKLKDLGPEGVTAMIERLEGEPDGMVSWFGEAVREMNDVKLELELEAGTYSKNPTMRAMCANLLGGRVAGESARAVARLLRDRVALVRQAAAAALWDLGATDWMEQVASLITDPDAEVRRTAKSSALALAAKGQLMPKLEELWCRAVQFADDEPTRALIEALGEMSETAGAHFAPGDALAAVKPHLDHRRPEVRREAAIAVGKFGLRDAVDPLMERLEREEDPAVLAQVCDALGKMADSKPVESLIELIRSEHLEVRKSALRALRKITKQKLGDGYEEWRRWYRPG